MSTHNIGFYEEISKIITKLSSNTHLISSAGIAYCSFIVKVLLSSVCYVSTYVESTLLILKL